MSHRIGRKRLRKAAVIRDDDEDEEEDAADAAPAEDMDAADGDGRPTGDETAAPAAASSSLQAYFKGRPTGASPPGAAKPSASAGGDAPVNDFEAKATLAYLARCGVPATYETRVQKGGTEVVHSFRWPAYLAL